MNHWQSPELQLPPQGHRILWYKNGDVFVASRWGNKYILIQPEDFFVLDAPELWMDAPMPYPYDGVIKVAIEGCEDLLTIDELEQKFPEEYKTLIESVVQGKFD